MFDKPSLYINETFRSLPFTSILFSLLISILFQNKISFIIFILLILDNSLNKIFKKIFKKYIPLDGPRPKGAKNCGCYIDLNNINKLSISHGMPSGHTQNIFFLTTFLTLYFKSTFKTLLLGIIAFYGGYLRIKFGCHTIKQVIIGGLFGILLASISYFLLKKNLVI